MVKVKKRGLSDKVHTVKIKKKDRNPFEIKVNKEKFKVLGRKINTDRGLPGVSRAKALKKRKATLLQEYKLQDKSNQFIDRRIGERNKAMTKEDRVMARFAAERIKAHNKKAIFNLAEDEVLTHKGRSLEEIERFDDPRSDDDDEDDPMGKGLDAKFVEEAHFGGGTLRKSDGSRLSVIDQLIADSKKRKAEKQKLREKTIELTDQLDEGWKDLIPALDMSKNDEVEKRDPYDLIMNELRYDARGKPSERLKTEEEIAAQEAKRLEEMEEERLRRMRGEDSEEETDVSVKRKHISADDLDDGFEIEDKPFEVTYDKDGVLIGTPPPSYVPKRNADLEAFLGGPVGSDDEEEDDDDESGEEEESDDEDEGDEDDTKEDGSDVEDSEGQEEDSKENGSEGGEDSEEKEESPLDEEKDLAKSNSDAGPEDKRKRKQDSEEPESPPKKRKEEEKQPEKKKVSFNSEVEVRTLKKKPNEDIRKAVIVPDLPYTFQVPESPEELEDLFKNREPPVISVILDRMIKCNHPGLSKDNKEKLTHLYGLLLLYLTKAPAEKMWPLLKNVREHLLTLAKFSPKEAESLLRGAIMDKYAAFESSKKKYPSHETYLLLSLVYMLYSTSDKVHSIASPSMVFMNEVLSSAKVTSRRAVASGLLVVQIIYEFTKLSKKLSTSSLAFLYGLFHMASPTSKECPTPFEPSHKFLVLQNPEKDSSLKMKASDLVSKEKIDNDFRVRCFATALSLAENLLSLYSTVPFIHAMVAPLVPILESIDISKYPEEIESRRKSLLETLQGLSHKPSLPQPKKVKPKILKLLEPKIERVYEGRKKKMMSEEKAELEKLAHKLKREKKGALREIRRDRSFLAKIKLKEQAASDAERVRKVKQIYSWASEQQGDLRKLERLKKKKI